MTALIFPWLTSAGECAPVAASAPMVGAVLAVRHLLRGHVPPVVLLACEVAAGGLIYVPSAFLIARSAANEVFHLLKKLRNRKAAPKMEEVSPATEASATASTGEQP